MRTLVTLTGPSCCGKTTLETALKAVGFKAAISTTTRPMRDGEVNGASYYFVTPEQFIGHLAAGQFIENVTFNGSKYGVTAKELYRVLDSGAPCVLVVEPKGLEQIQRWAERNTDVQLFSVFLDSPQDVIAERFLNRFAGDLALSISKGRAGMEGVMKTYSKRLGVMMTEETSWREDCDLIDLHIEAFNETNMESTVEYIRQIAFSDIPDCVV